MLLSESGENQLKYRKTRLVIVIIVCALAVVQIVYACTGKIFGGSMEGDSLSDYFQDKKQFGHDMFSDDKAGIILRTNFFLGFSLHIIIPIIIIIATILPYVKKKRQIFFLPILLILPAIILEIRLVEYGVVVNVPSIWVSTSKYALSVGIISTALLLAYDLLPYIGKIMGKKRLDRGV